MCTTFVPTWLRTKFRDLDHDMAFKPNRELLNANFEGYKLAEEALPSFSKDLSVGVSVAKLKDEQFSYQHMRACSLHNHLVMDPEEDSSVYWYADDCTIQHARFKLKDESLLTIKQVYQTATPKAAGGYHMNASISFIGRTLCLFSNGLGSLELLYTGNRSASEEWRLLQAISLEGLEGKTFEILTVMETSDHSHFNVATLELQDPPTLKRISTSTTPSTIVIYRWHRLKLSKELTSIGSQFVELGTGVPKSVVEETFLLCTFQSRTIALYCSFTPEHLLVISESNLIHMPVKAASQEPATKDVVTTSHPQDLELEEDSRQQKFQGLGYLEEKAAYKWTQSETDVVITIDLPTDVGKCDISCVIEREEIVVGLTDGSTFVRGKLHEMIDPAASTWSIEKHILEVTLEKVKEGQWVCLLKGEGQLPLSEGLSREGLSKEELEEIERKIKEVSSATSTANSAPESEDGPQSAKKPRPLIQNTLEECDTTEEDAVLFVLEEDGSVSQKAGLGGRQFLFTVPSPAGKGESFCVRHNVDAVVWSPNSQTGKPSTWNHTATFQAIGYIQASKRERKFTTSPVNMRFLAISDCNRHVFVYKTPGYGENASLQYVHTLSLSSQGSEILGLRASNEGVLFVLCEKELVVLVVKTS